MIIPSPMDSQEYDCIGKEDPLLSHAKSKFKIVSVAVTELHLYGVNPFLQALSALRKRYDFHLFIIGSKSQRYMQVMNDKLEENNMKECTTVVCNVPPDRIPSIYINADVFFSLNKLQKLQRVDFRVKQPNISCQGHL